jgi:Protein of unknown function (DUF1573)
MIWLRLIIVFAFLRTGVSGSDVVNFSETAYDFGTVRQGEQLTHVFTFQNSSNMPVTIQRVELDLPGISARFQPNIEPGQKGRVIISWDTSHVTGAMQELAIVSFAGDSPPLPLTLKAVVQPPIEVLPYPAIFLSAFQGEGKETRLRIINHEPSPLKISLEQVGSDLVKASVKAEQPGRIYELLVRPGAKTGPGRYEDQLTLVSDNPGTPAIKIPVHMFIKPDLYPNPEAIDFGAVRMDELRNPSTSKLLAQTFLLKKRTGNFAITRISTDVSMIKVIRSPDQGGESIYRIDLALNPQSVKEGDFEGTVMIKTSDARFPEIRVPLRGTILSK